MIDLKSWLISSYGINSLIGRFLSDEQAKTINIGLIDYAINYMPKDDFFNAKISFGGCHLDQENVEENDHGLFSSSLIIAQGNRNLRGLIPNANLFFYNLNPNDNITEDNLILAIDWMIKKKVQLICLPFGSDRNIPAVVKIINKAIGLNILILAAAGNEYPKYSLFPARLDNVISVGALDMQYLVLDDCCINPEPDCWLPGLKIPGLTSSGQLAYRSGTSVSCLLATGFAANYLAKTNQKSISKKDFINHIKELNLIKQ
ncbi:MAG: hypothetical protein BWK73_31105 [Thiothrix lacustris]|uniref:Peptidase S8/S53 domain-containing protein n=1 Tax=Thiothrix lacustris TaxID=525917 RepID=A0A1Y1QIA3_9GAMM|nr:MAG: hypothetical protein BWK73_31105 [Thiothrix lacustris]